MSCRCHPLHCVVPPHVLTNIARNGSDHQRDWALRSLAADVTVRQARVQNMAVRAGGPREGADALAATFHPARPNRIISDARHSEDVAGAQVVRRERDDPTGDPAADEAYDGLGDTFRFFQERFRRDSVDDEAMPLRGVVHFGEDHDNAYWDGRRMIFGDGDGELFVRFTLSLDVIGHELGHGVIEDEAGLEYFGQPGALNEHWADVCGSLVKQYKLGQTADQADWLIGAEILGPEVQGEALRSMKAPGTAYDDDVLGKDPQPDHWDRYERTFEDFGGVHINSGIPNHAFYRLATSLGGNSWGRPGRIWYEALRHPRLRSTATFRQFAAITHRVARQWYGDQVADEVQGAWDAVGIAWE